MGDKEFAQAFPAYLANARTARAENRHHDYRRGLFLDLPQFCVIPVKQKSFDARQTGCYNPHTP